MSTPAQKGTQLVQYPSPTFAEYLVVDKTWKEKPNNTSTITKDGTSSTVNVMWADPGIDAQCDLVLKKGTGPDSSDPVLLTQGDTLTELTAPDGGDVREWLVVEPPDNSDFGGMPVKQSVKLLLKESLDVS